MIRYVSPTGSDTTGTGTSEAPYKTIAKAFSVGAGGDTVIAKDGTYGALNLSEVKKGTAAAYSVVKAENDGKAIFGGLTSSHSSGNLAAYIRVEGLKFTGSGSKDIQGSYLKFFRCAFQGGPSSGNAVAVAIGSNDFTPVTHHCLLEDCWIWGRPAGRYSLLIFNAEKITVRRLVARHEGGWKDTKGDPEAVVALYNSSECVLQDLLLIDGVDTGYNTFDGYGAFYLIRNQSASPDHVNFGNVIRGLVVVNTINCGFVSNAANTTQTPINQLIDAAFVNTRHFGMSWGGSDSNTNMTGKGLIVVRKNMVGSPVSNSGGLGYWSSGNINISNAIISGFTTAADIQGVKVSNYDTFNNGGYGSGTGKKTYDPFTNGLKYPTRVEAGSQLEKDGIGPKILTKWGVSGTIVGESGVDIDTGEPLWPWPNEARIKEDMAGGPAGGWGTSSKTLTQYIWESLGNPIPSDIYNTPPVPAPTATISADKNTIVSGQSVVITWATANAVTVTINGTAVAANGSLTVSPTANVTYTITATGAGGTTTTSTSVTVTAPPPPPAPTATISVDKPSVEQGKTVILAWTTTNATTVSINGTSVPTSGSQEVAPTITTTYTITATGAGGTVNKSVVVTVTLPPPPPAPTASLTVDKVEVQQGGSVVLTWVTTDATSIQINGLAVSSSGSMTMAPTESVTYTLVAAGPGGTVSDAVTVTVTVPPPPPPPDPTVFDYLDEARAALDKLEAKLGPRS